MRSACVISSCGVISFHDVISFSWQMTAMAITRFSIQCYTFFCCAKGFDNHEVIENSASPFIHPGFIWVKKKTPIIQIAFIPVKTVDHLHSFHLNSACLEHNSLIKLQTKYTEASSFFFCQWTMDRASPSTYSNAMHLIKLKYSEKEKRKKASMKADRYFHFIFIKNT